MPLKNAKRNHELRGLFGTRAAPVGARRLAWSGLTREEVEREGGLLLALLIRTANDRGLQMQELAAELGVTYGYINQLRKGDREVQNISDEFVDACAAFLNLPRIAVLIAAKKVRLSDMYQEPGVFSTHLEAALQFIQKDPHVGCYMPVETFKTTPAIQQFIVMLYEQATGRVLIPGKVELKDLVGSLSTFVDPIPQKK